ncbi:hypothetical protein [Mesorhizobium sp.]|uniref:hypothetical protein n=1 Tax=Mesorhizobium sp. TaxID=1871066 RepID=UPI0032AE9CC1
MFGDDIKAMANTLGNDLRRLLRGNLAVGLRRRLAAFRDRRARPADLPAPSLLLIAGSA